MTDSEVVAVATRAGVRWFVLLSDRALVFAREEDARDFAQLLVARGASFCPRCSGLVS